MEPRLIKELFWAWPVSAELLSACLESYVNQRPNFEAFKVLARYLPPEITSIIADLVLEDYKEKNPPKPQPRGLLDMLSAAHIGSTEETLANFKQDFGLDAVIFYDKSHIDPKCLKAGYGLPHAYLMVPAVIEPNEKVMSAARKRVRNEQTAIAFSKSQGEVVYSLEAHILFSPCSFKDSNLDASPPPYVRARFTKALHVLGLQEAEYSNVEGNAPEHVDQPILMRYRKSPPTLKVSTPLLREGETISDVTKFWELL